MNWNTLKLWKMFNREWNGMENLQYIHLVLSIIMADYGFLCIITGIIIKYLSKKYPEVYDEPIYNLGTFIGGISLILIFACGCYGSRVKSSRLLYTCSVGVMFLAVIWISFSVNDLIEKPAMENAELQKEMQSFIKSKTDLDQKYRWDYIHSTYKCCGVHGPQDYIEFHNETHPRISCCLIDESSDNKSEEEILNDCISMTSYYVKGCGLILVYNEIPNYITAIFINFIFGFVMMFCSATMIAMAKNINFESKAIQPIQCVYPPEYVEAVEKTEKKF